MGRLFVVDTENTNDYSFFEKYSVAKEDKVVLFVSENMKGIKSEGCLTLLNTEAKVMTEQVETGEKNLLDFQLVVYVTERAIRGRFKEIYIVSNDHGYRQVCNYIKKKYRTNIQMIEVKKPTTTVAAPIQEKKVEAVVKKEIKPKEVEMANKIKTIVKGIVPKASDTQIDSVNRWVDLGITPGELHNNVVKMFGEHGKEIYKKIKPLLNK